MSAARRLRRRPPPRIPPEVEQLRNVRRVVCPWKTYSMTLPDGRTFSSTGADMIAQADAMVALADADKRHDRDGMNRALSTLARMI
jgi:hypothetical protein